MDEKEIELSCLNSFLNEALPRATSLYVELFVNQQNSLGDEELEAAVVNGFDAALERWRAEYETFATEKLIPLWTAALKAGARSVEREFSIELDPNSREVRDWLNRSARSFVETATRNLERTIENTLRKCREKKFTPTQTAYALRPMIGLYPRQAASNWRFQRTFVRYLLNPRAQPKKLSADLRSISDELQALRDKLEGALDYSLEQIQQRARMLAELGTTGAFNKGKHEILRQAIELGLLGVCEKIWVTANDHKVCDQCWLMSGAVAAFDESFKDKDGYSVGSLPPLHPNCRCVIFYHRILPPGLNDLSPEAMSAPNTSPYLLGTLDPSDGAMIAEVIRHYEELIVNAPIENAIVITTDGEVYHVTGDKNFITPLAELDTKLNGAIVTHNHPSDSAGDYEFSAYDTDFFKDYSLGKLRGIDEKFVYELNHNPQDSEFKT